MASTTIPYDESERLVTCCLCGKSRFKYQTMPAIINQRICMECEEGIKRKKPPKQRVKASTARYAREIEKGQRKAPYKVITRLISDGIEVTTYWPLLLTEAGRIPKIK